MPDDWRPIETAPRDGTRIIAARFFRGEDPIVRVDYWHRPEDGSSYTGFGNFNAQFWPPTHWMPIPPPPPES